MHEIRHGQESPTLNNAASRSNTPLVKYLAAILAFVAVAMALSWWAVFSFWYAALLFRSVPAVRISDAISSVILLPVRLLFWLAGDTLDQSVPLSNPVLYAAVNAALLGILGYACCRRLLWGKGDGR